MVGKSGRPLAHRRLADVVVDFPPIDLGFAFQLVAFLLGLAVFYGALRSDLRNMKATLKVHGERFDAIQNLNLDGRLTAVEAHGEKVAQIGPLVEKVAQSERRFESAIEAIRDDARELARTVRELTQAAFARSRV